MTSMRLEQADGPALHVAVDGHDRGPVVVLLHGAARSHRSWDWVVPAIGATHTVVRPDLRGHGGSGRAEGYLLADHVADAVAVIDEVADAPVVLVGHSLGGLVAAAVAQQRPALVRATLLEEPALALARAATGPPVGATAEDLRMRRDWAQRPPSPRPTEGALARRLAGEDSAFGAANGQRYTIDALGAWAHGLLHLDPTALDPILDPVATHLGTGFDIDAGVPQRTVVLAADLAAPDRVTGRRDEQRLTAASPALRWVRVDGGGHNLHEEQDHRATVREHLVGLLAVA